MFLSKVNEGIALAQRPPIDLRVNNLLSTTSKVARQLSFCGAMPVSWCRHALRVAPARGLNRRPNLQRSEAFKSGLFEVQDIGSQVVSYLCQVKPGMEILDYCAGSGGKALAFSAEMRNVGKIHAFDARKSRIVPIFARLSRANVRNVQVHVERDTLDSLLGCIDVVVIDAPCTGSGTWRRNPDMKWRLTDMQLSRRIEEQYDILEKASVFVRPGGHLVYITCSLFFEENDWQVERFLTHHSSFQLKNMRKHWNRLMPEQAPIPYVSKNGLLLSPFATGTDGFFISVIEKTI
jgi:16S rRNA (cytosine967-C5)-methyltransferase